MALKHHHSSIAISMADGEQQIASAADFIALLKPRVVALVVFTAWVGMMVSPQPIHPFMAFVSLFCIALAAGGAGAINMWYDHDIDAVMKRTRLRPIPRGAIDRWDALAFGILLSVLAIMMMALAINHQAALWLACANGFYVFIYTMGLKRYTAQNIVIGGAAGAFPPLVGWVASGAAVSLYPVLLFMMIFLWTPPHFWALALAHKDDYQRSAIPMLPVVKGRAATRRAILVYAFCLVAVSLLPWFFGFVGAVYGCIAIFLNAVFLAHSLRVYVKDNTENCFAMFKMSIFYLFFLFSALLGESIR